MSKVTSKLQVTLPKAIADRYGVKAGSDVVFEPAGDSIRVLIAREPGLVPSPGHMSTADKQTMLDAASIRQTARNRRYQLAFGAAGQKPGLGAKQVERGWTREELYDRGRAR